VHPDQNLVAVTLAGGDDPGLDTLERRQIALGPASLAACGGGAGLAVCGGRFQVDVVQPPVLVSASVLQVQQMPAVLRPGEDPDTPVGLVGYHHRGVPVDAG